MNKKKWREYILREIILTIYVNKVFAYNFSSDHMNAEWPKITSRKFTDIMIL